jgi:hypothetical protein
MSNGYLIASRILEALSGENKIACLQALHEAEQGQAKLSSGDWDGCIAHAMRAYDLLTNIPEAAPILGVVKQDIAAAYGNLGKTTEASRFAQDAIQLVHGVKELAYTEAMAHMTVGITCYRSGNEQQGARHFASARSLLKNRPGSEQVLRLLDDNEAKLKADLSKTHRKWWQFW